MKKIFLLICLLISFCYSNDVYKYVTTKFGTFADFGAYITAKGDSVTSFQMDTDWTVSGHVTPRSTFEFFSIIRNSRFYGTIGSGHDGSKTWRFLYVSNQ